MRRVSIAIAMVLGIILLVAWFWRISAPPKSASVLKDVPLYEDRIVTVRMGPPEIYPRVDLNPGLANPDVTPELCTQIS